MSASFAPFDIPGFREPTTVDAGPGYVVVHAVTDEHEQAVAITLHDVPLDEPAQRRLLHDGEVARRLGNHPHAVTVHETRVLTDGRGLIVTDRYEGGRLDMRVERRGRLALTDALRVGIALAGVLETAHRAGVIHRAVSPRKVLLAKDGRPALADLGLSWLTEREGVATRFGLTPYHAPPEVLENTDATPASDVYSLASTLYALLAGFAPYETPGGGDTSASLLLRILHQRVPPLGRSDVPDTLDRVLRTALAPEQGARQQRALFFAQQLQAVQHELGSEITGPTVLDLGASPGLETAVRQVFVPAPQFLDDQGPPLQGSPLQDPPPQDPPPQDPPLQDPPPQDPPPSSGAPTRSNGQRPWRETPDRGSGFALHAGAPDGGAMGNGAVGPGPGTAVAVADREPADVRATTIAESPFWTEPLRPPLRVPVNRALHRVDRARPRPRPPEPKESDGGPVASPSPPPVAAAAPTREPPPAIGPDPAAGPRVPPRPAATERANAPPARRVHARPPALPVLVLLTIVAALALGAVWLVATGEDARPTGSNEGDTTGGDAAASVPTGLTAVESDAGVQLDWDGSPDARYVVMIMSETTPPELRTTASGSALLIAAADLRPGEGYCFGLAHSDAVAAAPTGRPDEAFGPPQCIRGASPAAMLTAS